MSPQPLAGTLKWGKTCNFLARLAAMGGARRALVSPGGPPNKERKSKTGKGRKAKEERQRKKGKGRREKEDREKEERERKKGIDAKALLVIGSLCSITVERVIRGLR
jgi:hypothetical protein